MQSRVRAKGAIAAFFVGAAGLLMAAGTCGSTTPKPPPRDDSGGDAGPPTAERAEFRLYAFAQVLGTIAPCGCTTEPLGGLQYAFGHIEGGSSPGNRLVLEPGSFLFPKPGGAEWPTDEAGWKQAHDRAALLHKRFSALGKTLVSGLGPTDVAAPQAWAPLSTYPMPRVVANVKLPDGGPKTTPYEIVKLRSGEMTWNVGVTAIIDPALAGADKLGEVTPPENALRREVDAMRKGGAAFTIALAQGDRAFADALAKASDVDMIVVGVVDGADRERLGAPAGNVGGTHVVEPGTMLQTVTELRLSVEGSAGDVPPASQWTMVPPKAVILEELDRVDARLTKFKADPDADASFISNLEAERKKLQGQLDAQPQGKAVATLEQVKITCKLPVDDVAKAGLAAYDGNVAAQNKTRFAGVKPAAPAKGAPGYSGIEACGDCHEEAVEFWKTTPHAGAYETLVRDNKEYDLSCVGCHVTGFRKPGGSEVVENAGLVDVQCEVCHGPASSHVEDGGDDLTRVKLEAPAELCATECHTEEHSDTFDYVPYLRDILGPGHGEAERKKLGDGPTGHELRQAGLKKAGGACKKM